MLLADAVCMHHAHRITLMYSDALMKFNTGGEPTYFQGPLSAVPLGNPAGRYLGEDVPHVVRRQHPAP